MKKKPYIIAFLFFIFDLASKQIVIHTLNLNESITIIKDFFYLTYTRNNGAAWSILKDQRILLILITVIVLFFINNHLHKETLNKGENFSFGLIVGGIMGNLFDRLFYHEVIDFLDFRFFGYNYPVFNFADSFIVIGIILLIIISIKKEHYEKNKSRSI